MTFQACEERFPAWWGDFSGFRDDRRGLRDEVSSCEIVFASLQSILTGQCGSFSSARSSRRPLELLLAGFQRLVPFVCAATPPPKPSLLPALRAAKPSSPRPSSPSLPPSRPGEEGGPTIRPRGFFALAVLPSRPVGWEGGWERGAGGVRDRRHGPRSGNQEASGSATRWDGDSSER